MRAFVEMFNQAAFHDDADCGHYGDSKEDRQWNRPVNDTGPDLRTKPGLNHGSFDFGRVTQEICLCRVFGYRGNVQDTLQRYCAECTDHEQGTVSEVNNAQSTKNECQPQRNQRIGRALVEPV